MTKKSNGILRRLLLVAVIGCSGWFLVKVWWPRHSPRYFTGALDNAVAADLSRLAVTDRDVLSQIHKEHSWWIFSWVESERTIRVQNLNRATILSDRIEKTARRVGCSYQKVESTTELELHMKRFHWLVERLKFVLPAGVLSATAHTRVPQVAFVIDDVAYETVSMDRFASLGVPLTFAILPREKHSKQLSLKANSLNFPVMLHLPMEPLDMVHNDPGPTGLYLKMSDQELKTQFDKNVASIPNLVGINNHMGSAFTESEPKMMLVMQWVKKRGVYFLDSRTTGKSVVCKEAKHWGVPCLVNETFLDNKDDVKSIEDQLDLVMKLALKEGQTIAIGHYRRKFLVQALANKLPAFKASGVQVVALPTFFHR